MDKCRQILNKKSWCVLQRVRSTKVWTEWAGEAGTASDGTKSLDPKSGIVDPPRGYNFRINGNQCWLTSVNFSVN